MSKHTAELQQAFDEWAATVDLADTDPDGGPSDEAIVAARDESQRMYEDARDRDEDIDALEFDGKVLRYLFAQHAAEAKRWKARRRPRR